MKTLNPKTVTHVASSVFALLFSGCVTTAPVIGAFQKEIRAQGFVSYNQPIGNPHSASDWNKFGPGAVLRSGTQYYYYGAKTLIGDQGIQDFMNPQNISPISLFSDKRVSGYDIDGQGGWTMDAVNKISAQLQLSSATDVDIKFGNAWLANAKSEAEMHQALRSAAKNMDASVQTGLSKRRFLVIQNAVFTDSVRYYFKQQKEGGVSADYKLTGQDIANLQAKGYKVVDGGVEVDEPRFIAFTPLPDVSQDVSH